MQALRNKSKYTGFLSRTYHSAKYAVEGLVYAYKNEKSLKLHAVMSLLGMVMGVIFKISLNEWSVMLIALGVILAFELVNTAMEACVDMVTLEYHDLAKVAKDCCGAATFVTSIISAIICGVIFIPKIFDWISML